MEHHGSELRFAGIPTVASFTGANKPQWMDVVTPQARPDRAGVRRVVGGGDLHDGQLRICHGINADSKGLLADEITTLTGGDARVADFRDGLFGPVSAPGTNRDRVFAPAAATLVGVTSDDLGARYMAWIALGGTEKHLPEDILTEVFTIAGSRPDSSSHGSPGGRPTCFGSGSPFASRSWGRTRSRPSCQQPTSSQPGGMGWSTYTGLVDSNGDAEMWLRLCNLGNRAIVHVPVLSGRYLVGNENRLPAP